MLLDAETEERATLAGDVGEGDSEDRLVSGTLVEGVVEVACREKMGRVQRVLLRSLEDEDHE